MPSRREATIATIGQKPFWPSEPPRLRGRPHSSSAATAAVALPATVAAFVATAATLPVATPAATTADAVTSTASS